MSTEEGGRGGLLVLRLWIDPGRRIRVRVTSTAELGQRQPTTTYAASSAEVLLLVERWLDEFAPTDHR